MHSKGEFPGARAAVLESDAVRLESAQVLYEAAEWVAALACPRLSAEWEWHVSAATAHCKVDCTRSLRCIASEY